ncbi:hypothetical protein M9Y10_045556 [Tritrichomonas musculus]|uniref:Uncharacterized protein n=1 Tax=Tritrichomonas musculus TaxID=1915356 RepID=A0ABR2JVJ7_9EUKA
MMKKKPVKPNIIILGVHIYQRDEKKLKISEIDKSKRPLLYKQKVLNSSNIPLYIKSPSPYPPDNPRNLIPQANPPNSVLQANPPNSILQANPPNSVLQANPPNSILQANPPNSILQANQLNSIQTNSTNQILIDPQSETFNREDIFSIETSLFFNNSDDFFTIDNFEFDI